MYTEMLGDHRQIYPSPVVNIFKFQFSSVWKLLFVRSAPSVVTFAVSDVRKGMSLKVATISIN
jgi:hypothetical protein